jgi:acyl carrier protein
MNRGKLSQHLLERCREHGVFDPDVQPGLDEDLAEAGLIDSMGLMTLEHIAEDSYGVIIPRVVLVAQLRTLNQVITHIDKAMPADRRAALWGVDDEE